MPTQPRSLSAKHYPSTHRALSARPPARPHGGWAHWAAAGFFVVATFKLELNPLGAIGLIERARRSSTPARKLLHRTLSHSLGRLRHSDSRRLPATPAATGPRARRAAVAAGLPSPSPPPAWLLTIFSRGAFHPHISRLFALCKHCFEENYQMVRPCLPRAQPRTLGPATRRHPQPCSARACGPVPRRRPAAAGPQAGRAGARGGRQGAAARPG